MTPDEQIKEGIKLLQIHFGQNPAAMTSIVQLQTKYGVKMFAEVPTSRAGEFHADAKLIASGVGITI